MLPEGAHIRGERLQRTPGDERSQRPDGSDAYFVPTPDGKSHAMPLQARGMIGLQNHVGRGIIRVVIHGIRTGQGSRRRETNIVCLNTNNSERHNTSPSAEDRLSILTIRDLPCILISVYRIQYAAQKIKSFAAR